MGEAASHIMMPTTITIYKPAVPIKNQSRRDVRYLLLFREVTINAAMNSTIKMAEVMKISTEL